MWTKAALIEHLWTSGGHGTRQCPRCAGCLEKMTVGPGLRSCRAGVNQLPLHNEYPRTPEASALKLVDHGRTRRQAGSGVGLPPMPLILHGPAAWLAHV